MCNYRANLNHNFTRILRAVSLSNVTLPLPTYGNAPRTHAWQCRRSGAVAYVAALALSLSVFLFASGDGTLLAAAWASPIGIVLLLISIVSICRVCTTGQPANPPTRQPANRQTAKPPNRQTAKPPNRHTTPPPPQFSDSFVGVYEESAIFGVYEHAEPAEVLMWSYLLSTIGGVATFILSGEIAVAVPFFTAHPEVLAWVALSEIIGYVPGLSCVRGSGWVGRCVRARDRGCVGIDRGGHANEAGRPRVGQGRP